MKQYVVALSAALAVSAVAGGASAATLIGAKSIHITSASDAATGNSTGSWLQVGEVVALNVGGVNVAFFGNGGSAFAPDKYSTDHLAGADDGAENAIDGVTPFAQPYSYPGSGLPGIYHSATTDNTVSYLDVTFSAPSNLKSLSIFGRADVPAVYVARDLYNVDIRDAGGNSIFTGQIDARNADHVGTLAFVPEPASWALMIGGFGMAGTMLRRRRAQTASAL
jgi:hypothetical protein